MRNPADFYLSDSEYRAFIRTGRKRSIPYDIADRLVSMGLVDLVRISANQRKARCALTRTGERYRDYSYHQRREQRFTRGIALTSIVISIISLLLAGLSLYLQHPELSRLLKAQP